MRFKKSFRKMLAVAIAAGTFAVMPLASAEVKEYEGFGEYVMSDFETPDVAKQRAKARAEQNAMEQAGVYVESYTKVINMQVTHDEITTMTNGILRVKDTQYKMLPTDDGKAFLIHAIIKADIDTDDVSKWLEQNKQKMSMLVEQNKELQKVMEEQDKQIEELKKQVANVKSEQDRERIQAQFTAADQEFLANQKRSAGLKSMVNGDYVNAVVLFSQVVELNPKDAFSYADLGDAYFELHDERKAIENYTKALVLEPTYSWIYDDRGLAYSNLGDYARAIADFTKAVEIEQRLSNAYINRGLAYSSLCDYSRAITDFTKAIELNPKLNAWIYGARGLAYVMLKNYSKAIDDCTRAIEFNPKDAAAFATRGLAYKLLGNIAQANADYVRAKELGYEL